MIKRPALYLEREGALDARAALRALDTGQRRGVTFRSPAELSEWERIAQLLADAAPGTDDVAGPSSPPTPRPPPTAGRDPHRSLPAW